MPVTQQTQQILQNCIQKFTDDANNRRKYQIAQYGHLCLSDPDLLSSIASAHTDMARRAEGHTPQIKEESIKFWLDYFKNNSPFGISNQNDFDKWHREACEAYCDHMNSKFPSFNMTIGRAQKVLNMIFKYLYCTDAYKADVEKIAKFLHMTLDRKILDWYHKDVSKICKITAWSKIDYYDCYLTVQKRIREYLKNNPLYDYVSAPGASPIWINLPCEPFFAEFIIW